MSLRLLKPIHTNMNERGLSNEGRQAYLIWAVWYLIEMTTYPQIRLETFPGPDEAMQRQIGFFQSFGAPGTWEV